MRNATPVLLALCFVLSFQVLPSVASDTGPDRDLHMLLVETRAAIETASRKIGSGTPVAPERARLADLAGRMRAGLPGLEKRLRLEEEEVIPYGAKALERHRLRSGQAIRGLEEYLILLEDSLKSEFDSLSLDRLKSALMRILPAKRRPIFGSLPVRHLNYPAREPVSSPSIVPAYKAAAIRR